MPQILITGGAGFIGGALAEKLALDPSNRIVVLDNFETSSPSAIPARGAENVVFIKADVNDYKDVSAVFFSWKFDVVFHYAALVGVRRTLDHPVKVLNDINGIRNILDLAKNTGVAKVFYSSSSEVYGEPVHIPQHEHTTPLNSRLPYAVVKNVGESFLRSYAREFGLEFTIFRFFNTYGPGQSRDFVISKYIHAALAGEPLSVYGDGSQTRTFCYIDDNVNATVNAFRQNQFVNDVVNIGSDAEYSILHVAREVIRLTNSPSEIVHLPPLEEGDMTRRKPDITNMKKLLGSDLIPFETGLSKVIGAFKSCVV